MTLLRLVRPLNLLLIVGVQSLLQFGLIYPLNRSLNLDPFHFVLLCISTIFIAAGGNIINDIQDIEIDKVNKPNKVLIGKKISETNAVKWYISFTAIGVLSGFYLANLTGIPGFASLFVLISALLYLYTSYFKGILLVGNLIISLLVSMSVLLVGIFELVPFLSPDNFETYTSIFKIILAYAFFAFLLNFSREIVKDIQDINGDKKGGLNTLPIAIGRRRAMSIVFWLGVVTIAMVITFMYTFIYAYQPLLLYFLVAVLAPLFYFCIQAWNAEKQEDTTLLSNLLKIIMILGMCSLLLYRFIT